MTKTDPSHTDEARGVQQTATGNNNAQLSGDKSVLNVINVNHQLDNKAGTLLSQQIDDEQGLKISWESRDNELLMGYFKQCRKYDSFFSSHVKLDEDEVRKYLIATGLAYKSQEGHTFLTHAGVIFCCKRDLIPLDIFHVCIKLVQRTDVEDLNVETFGSVLYLYKWLTKQLAPFLNRKIGSPDNRDETGGEILYSEYPRVAIIEGMVNFLIHRNYFQDDIGWVTVYSDRIEFTNPGQSEIDPDRLLMAMSPLRPRYKRNPRLIEAMSRAHLNQREGSGILRIRRELEQNRSYRSDGGLGLTIENDSENDRFRLVIYKRVPQLSKTIDSSDVTSVLPHLVYQPGSAPPLPSLIIGREDDLRELKIRLGFHGSAKHPSKIQVLTALRGWPGVGKTTLAAALAHDPDVIANFPDGVLWASLGSTPSLLAELAAWGRALGTDDLLKAETVEEASSQLTALLQNKRMLLILDDVWEPEHTIPFKIGGRDCAMLVTTRVNNVAQAIAPTPDNIYKLSVLTDENALHLLQTLAPSVIEKYPEKSLELVHELEGLPLALQVAGRMLSSEANYGFDVAELLTELKQGAKLLEANSPADRADLANETTPSVAALLQKSTNRLDALTRDCFAYLGVFAPKPATFDLNAMKAVWEIEDPKPIARTLVDRGLLEFVPELNRYQMHALLVMLAKSILVER